MPSYDPTAPCLVLAPHLRYPTRNGADILVDRIGRHLSRHVPHVDLIGAQHVVRFRDGEEAARDGFTGELRGQTTASLLTIFHRSHLLLEQYLTPGFEAVSRHYLDDDAYGTVLLSHISTTRMLERAGDHPRHGLYAVLTHMDEFAWFQALQQSANPLTWLAARQSQRWLHRFFRTRGGAYLYVHVREADREGYRAHGAAETSAVIPMGVELPSAAAPPVEPGTSTVRLLFTGSLDTPTNTAALDHFAGHYLPPLRAHLGDALQVEVAGSRPTPAVAELCKTHDWTLHPDLSDDALRERYHEATFAVLPFAAPTGTKLKLLHALAHGVPVLASAPVRTHLDAWPAPSLSADDPAEWIARIDAVRRDGITAAQRAALVGQAQRHSWQASAEALYDVLREQAR